MRTSRSAYSHRHRRLRSAARSAAAWLADALVADPDLPADTIARQLALMRFLGALARASRPLRLYRPREE